MYQSIQSAVKIARQNVLPKLFVFALLLAVGKIILPTSVAQAEGPDTRPNILILLADDMGYSDVGAYGGEAETPNIDTLAKNGTMFTNFHSLPSCSPARSVLLTSVDNHLNGFGTMGGNDLKPTQVGKPGYELYFNKRVVTLARLLKDSGYHTYMTGKWHLSEHTTSITTPYPRGAWPIDVGFEQSWGHHEGGGSHTFLDRKNLASNEGTMHFFENDKLYDEVPEGFYTTKNFTDEMIRFIKEGKQSDGATRKPFFGYLAYTAPHYPLEAPKEYIDKYLITKTTYSEGWDKVREARFQKMKELGVIPSTMVTPTRWPGVPAWDNPNDPAWATYSIMTRTQNISFFGRITDTAGIKKSLVKDYAVYAAMIDYMDEQIGKVFQTLKDSGEYSNTVFIFLSDNGADSADFSRRPGFVAEMIKFGLNNSYENQGGTNSLSTNAKGWAQVSSLPAYGSKTSLYEGGVHAPLIISYPQGGVKSNVKSQSFLTMHDLAPTILEYAGISKPVTFTSTEATASAVITPTTPFPNRANCTGTYTTKDGKTLTGLCPMQGKSMKGLLEGTATTVHADNEAIGYELFGLVSKALYMGDWKASRIAEARNAGFTYDANGKPVIAFAAQWKLFNLKNDPTETTNLASTNPDQLSVMVQAYMEYERNVGFVSGYPATYLPVVIHDISVTEE